MKGFQVVLPCAIVSSHTSYIIRDGLSQKTISRYCPFKVGRSNTTFSVLLFGFLWWTLVQSKAGILGRVMGGKIDSWNWEGTKYGIESAMSHKLLICKAGINFLLGFSLPPSRESILRRIWFSLWIDSVESMPGVPKSVKIRALTYCNAMHRYSHGALVIFDLSRPETFPRAEAWIQV
jgi:hypothetical protein